MTKLNEIYKCDICGNMVEMLHTGAGELVCCGQPMNLQIAKTKDEGQEKHVPVIEKTKKGYRVKVGDTLHPMEEEHFIEWAELLDGENVQRKYLKPGDEPIIEFESQAEKVDVREYCNIHGLWKTK